MSAKTSIMEKFDGRVSATKRSIPRSLSVAGEHLEQERPDPPALEVVAHDEGDLGLPAVVEPLGAADPDDLVADEGHERRAVGVVHRGEMGHLGLGQLRVGGEVAEVDALGREPAVERQQASPVLGPDRP